MLSREFQSTCLAFRFPAIKTGNLPPKQTSMSAPISGREGQHNMYGSCLQLGEARHRYRVVSNTTTDQYGRATPGCWSVCAVADIETNIDTVFAEKVLQLELSASHSVSIPAGAAQSFTPTVFLRRAAIFGHEENDGLQDSPRAGCPCGEGGDGREEPTSQFHTCLEGKAMEEIGDFLEWVVGDHKDGSCVFSGRGFHTRD